MTENYRDLLIDAIDHLITVRDELFTNAINIAMANELKEIDDAFEEGERFQFELEHLEDAKDVNLQKLVNMIKAMNETIDEMININAIDDKELGFDEDDIGLN